MTSYQTIIKSILRGHDFNVDPHEVEANMVYASGNLLAQYTVNTFINECLWVAEAIAERG